MLERASGLTGANVRLTICQAKAALFVPSQTSTKRFVVCNLQCQWAVSGACELGDTIAGHSGRVSLTEIDLFCTSVRQC